MHKLSALLSDGKDKLDLFLESYRRNRALESNTNRFNKGELGARFAVILLIIAAIWFVYRLFS